MSELNLVYAQMWADSINKFSNNTCDIDPLINNDNDNDTRRGVTVLSYFDQAVVNNISSFLDELKTIEPEQYYYPRSDLHLTILSIISCIEGFNLSDIDVDVYSNVFNKAVKKSGAFKIHFKGITVSSSCILIQGFPDIRQLDNLRELLRQGFKNANVETTIDSRYKISTAHSTVVRCTVPFNNSEALMKVLNKYKNHDFGTILVDSLALVFNNWYQNTSITKIISKAEL